MANTNLDHTNAPKRSDHDASVISREQSPKRTVVQPLDLKKILSEQSSKTGKARTSTADRDIKPKRTMLQDDMVHSSGYEELEDQVLNSIPTAASASSSQSSASRRPPSPSRRYSSKLPSHQYSVTAPSSPRHIDDTTPIDAPSRTGNAAQNYSRRSDSYSRAHSVDYTNYSGAAPIHQNGRKAFHQESTHSLPSRRPSYAHQRHSSTATASSARRLSHYTFESPHAGTPSYSYSPEEYSVDDGPMLEEDGGLDIPASMGMPNLQMASNAVMKANLRSEDPYRELSRFLDNVNGMLSSLTLSIPHLQLLCDRYRSIQEKLLEYNALVEVNRAQEEVIEQKEKQVFSLKEKLNQMSTIHSAEGNRLRNRIGSLEAEIRILNDIIAAKNREIGDLASKFEEEKETLRSEREQWGAANGEALLEEKLELLEKHEAEIEILEEGHYAKVKEIEEAHAVEKAEMTKSFESKIKDLEERHQAELIDISEKKASEVNDIQRQVALQLENNHEAKLTALRDAHGVEIWALESKFYAKLETLKVDVGKRRAELEKTHATEKKLREEEFQKERSLWITEKEQLEGQIKYLQYEKNTTAFTHEAEKNSLLEMVQSSEQTTRQLETENERINALLKNIGDADPGQEIKGRGDEFYIDAFTTLTKDIVDISSKFLDLSRMPPGDIIAEIPSNLPNILADTDPSCILRQAYIQHVISTILCRRIFSPFLFSLADRYDNADSLLTAMSTHIRKKSTRREAVWRNYTLIAAYTANSAKSHAASAASNVIEEIITKIRPFSEPENMDRILAGVRRVVKYAIDTWRYARLEKEMFVARIETEADDAVWGHHSYEKQLPYVSDPKLIETILARSTGRKKLVLHLLPLIYREGTVPVINQPDTVLDDGHVFTHGVALFSDCLPVLHRKMELQSPGSNSSSCGEDRVQRRKEPEKSDRAIGEFPGSRHMEDARMRAQQMELEKKGEVKTRAEKDRLERENEEALRREELEEHKRKEETILQVQREEIKRKKQEEASMKEEQTELKQQEKARLLSEQMELERQKEQKVALVRAELEEAEKRELERIQEEAEEEKQLRFLEEARIEAEQQEEEAREASLMEAVELEALERIEAEIETAAQVDAQLIAEEKYRRDIEPLLEAAKDMERMELETQRLEDEDRERALWEMNKIEQLQAEQEILARVEEEIRDAEEAEAQLFAEEKARMERLRLEAEAKARADEEEIEREKLRQREIRRKEVRAKIEAEVAAKKLERERERERQRLKAEAEESRMEAERQRLQALAEAEAEAERLRLESETKRDLLQGKMLTAAVGGGARSNIGAIEEVDERNDVMSDVEVSTLGHGIAEAALILSMGTESVFRGAAESEVGRAIPKAVVESAEIADESIVREVAEKAVGQTKGQVIESATREAMPDTKDRGLLADEGGSMIWLRLSEPEARSEINYIAENKEQDMAGPIHAYEQDHPHIPIPELSKDNLISRLQERSVPTTIEGHNPTPAGVFTDFDGEVGRNMYSDMKPHTMKEQVKQVKMDTNTDERGEKVEDIIYSNRDLDVEDIDSVYSEGGGTYLSQPGLEPLADEKIEEELDPDDESFDSCGASVGGQDDEESDYERGVEEDEEEGIARKTVIGEEDGLTELPPLPPVTLERQTPGGVELASFDFGLGPECDKDYETDPQWTAQDWEDHHGVAESSGGTDGNGHDFGGEHVAEGYKFVAQEGLENQRDGHEVEPQGHEGNHKEIHVVGHDEAEVHHGEPHIESRGLSRQHHDRFDADNQSGGDKGCAHKQGHEGEQEHIHNEEDTKGFKGVEGHQNIEGYEGTEEHEYIHGYSEIETHESIEGHGELQGNEGNRNIEFRSQGQHSEAESQVGDQRQQQFDEEHRESDYGSHNGGQTDIDYGSEQGEEEEEPHEYDRGIVEHDRPLSESDHESQYGVQTELNFDNGYGSEEEHDEEALEPEEAREVWQEVKQAVDGIGKQQDHESRSHSQFEQDPGEVNSHNGQEELYDTAHEVTYANDHQSEYGPPEIKIDSDQMERGDGERQDEHHHDQGAEHEEEGHQMGQHGEIVAEQDEGEDHFDSRAQSRLGDDGAHEGEDVLDTAQEGGHGKEHGEVHGGEHGEGHRVEHEIRPGEITVHEAEQHSVNRAQSLLEEEHYNVGSQYGDENQREETHDESNDSDNASHHGGQTKENHKADEHGGGGELYQEQLEEDNGQNVDRHDQNKQESLEDQQSELLRNPDAGMEHDTLSMIPEEQYESDQEEKIIEEHDSEEFERSHETHEQESDAEHSDIQSQGGHDIQEGEADDGHYESDRSQYDVYDKEHNDRDLERGHNEDYEVYSDDHYHSSDGDDGDDGEQGEERRDDHHSEIHSHIDHKEHIEDAQDTHYDNDNASQRQSGNFFLGNEEEQEHGEEHEEEHAQELEGEHKGEHKDEHGEKHKEANEQEHEGEHNGEREVPHEDHAEGQDDHLHRHDEHGDEGHREEDEERYGQHHEVNDEGHHSEVESRHEDATQYDNDQASQDDVQSESQMGSPHEEHDHDNKEGEEGQRELEEGQENQAYQDHQEHQMDEGHQESEGVQTQEEQKEHVGQGQEEHIGHKKPHEEGHLHENTHPKEHHELKENQTDKHDEGDVHERQVRAEAEDNDHQQSSGNHPINETHHKESLRDQNQDLHSATRSEESDKNTRDFEGGGYVSSEEEGHHTAAHGEK